MSMPDTFQANPIPPINHQEVFSLPDPISSRTSLSTQTSQSGSKTTTSNPSLHRNSTTPSKSPLELEIELTTQAAASLSRISQLADPSAPPITPRNPRFDRPLPIPTPIARKPKPYPKDLVPIPSNLRPHCHARDRLREWRPRESSDGVDVFDEPHIKRLQDLLQCAWNDNTRAVYGSGLLAFHVWCDQKEIKEEDRAPASGQTIVLFISSLAGGFAQDTIINYVSGVRAWHILHYMPWEMDVLQYQAALKVTERAAPPSSHRPKRKPCLVDDLITIRQALDITTPLGAAVWACTTIAFYSMARLGELVVANLNSFVQGQAVGIDHIRTETDRNNLEVISLHIPYTKVTRAKGSSDGEDIFWAEHKNETDPKAALKNHITINNPQKDEHLFAYSKSRNERRPLPKHAFSLELNRAFREANKEPLKGHSFRIGGTLELLLRGVPFEVVKRKGRWASDAFQTYLRQHAQIMAPYVQDVPALRDMFIELQLSDRVPTALRSIAD